MARDETEDLGSYCYPSKDLNYRNNFRTIDPEGGITYKDPKMGRNFYSFPRKFSSSDQFAQTGTNNGSMNSGETETFLSSFGKSKNSLDFKKALCISKRYSRLK